MDEKITPIQLLLAELIAISALSVLLCQAQIITITTEPLSVNTSANEEVIFYCAAENANLFFWYLNNTYVKYIVEVKSDVFTNISVNPPTSFLMLWISDQYLNESLIKCMALNHFGDPTPAPVNSTDALLLIQGPLGLIEDIKVSPKCEVGVMSVSWTRPYTLKGIVIPKYNICVDEMCSLERGDVNHTTQPFPVINVSFSDEYTLCLQAFDSTSNAFTKASCTDFSLNKVPNRVSYQNIQPKLTFSANAFQVEVEVDLEGGNVCQLPQNYTTHLTFSNGTNISYTPSIISQSKTGACLVVPFDEQLIETNLFIRVIPMNSAGSNTSDPISIALFHVQDAHHNGNNITCTFVDGSTAQGCSTTLASANKTLITCKILRASQTEITASGSFLCQENSPDSTSYDLYVFDIFSDGSVSNQPAVTLRDVTIVPPTTCPPKDHLEYYLIAAVITVVMISVVIIFVLVWIICRLRTKISKNPSAGKRLCEKSPLLPHEGDNAKKDQ